MGRGERHAAAELERPETDLGWRARAEGVDRCGRDLDPGWRLGRAFLRERGMREEDKCECNENRRVGKGGKRRAYAMVGKLRFAHPTSASRIDLFPAGRGEMRPQCNLRIGIRRGSN